MSATVDRPAYGTEPIRCGKMKCKWRGYEGDLIGDPDSTSYAITVTQNVCPLCGCKNYMFMTPGEIKAWKKRGLASQPDAEKK